MITIKDIILLEKRFLEFENDYKFVITLDELFILEEYINKIGRITSIYFNVQFEFSRAHEDKDEVQKYHDKLTDCELKYDFSDAIEFINNMCDKYKKTANS